MTEVGSCQVKFRRTNLCSPTGFNAPVPDARLHSKAAHGFVGVEVTRDGKGVVDCGAGGNEALGLVLGFEVLHLALSSSDRKMRVLAPVVVA